MIFSVRRASDWSESKKPCNGATKRKILHTDERYFDDPMKNPMVGNTWYTDEGFFNHRVEDGHCKRDWYKEGWVIEINTMDELMKFMDEYGNIIIFDSSSEEFKEIVIYDDWVE